jgi:hypothetical protein
VTSTLRQRPDSWLLEQTLIEAWRCSQSLELCLVLADEGACPRATLVVKLSRGLVFPKADDDPTEQVPPGLRMLLRELYELLEASHDLWAELGGAMKVEYLRALGKQSHPWDLRKNPPASLVRRRDCIECFDTPTEVQELQVALVRSVVREAVSLGLALLAMEEHLDAKVPERRCDAGVNVFNDSKLS